MTPEGVRSGRSVALSADTLVPMASQHPDALLTTECPYCASYGVPVLEGFELAEHPARLHEPFRIPDRDEKLCPGVTPERLFSVWFDMLMMETESGSRWPAMHPREGTDG